jgi:hypothetical protein
MDLRKFRQDVRHAVSIKNKVEVPRGDPKRLGDMATPFQHHAVAEKYLRYKNGKLYSKLFSPTEFLARLGDKPSREALRHQSKAALGELARRVDNLYGAGTAERIGLTQDHAALTSRTLNDLDYHAAAAAALHQLGVCHDASVAERDQAVQALKTRMRNAVADDASQAADLRKLATTCAGQQCPNDVKELALARDAMNSLAPNYPQTGDETAVLQIKLAMQPLLSDPNRPMSALDAAQACAVAYHGDLDKVEKMLGSMGLITETPLDAVQWPGPDALQIVASSRQLPLSNHPQAIKAAVLRFALGTLHPVMDDNAARTAADEIALSEDFPELNADTLALIKATHDKHQRISPPLMRQTRLDNLLREDAPDPLKRREWLKRELQVAAGNANEPNQAFSANTPIGKTMAVQAGKTPGMKTFLDTHLPAIDGLIASLPSDLTQQNASDLLRDTVAAFHPLFAQAGLEDQLPADFRKDLRIGIDAIDASSNTTERKEALKNAWRNDMLARYVLAPALERHVIAKAAAREDASTAAALLRQTLLRMVDGPTAGDRARMDPADLAAWDQFLIAWRSFLSRADMPQDNAGA